LIAAWQYDVFGRKTLETRPDGTNTLTAYQDCAAVSYCVGQVKTAVTVTNCTTANVTINDSKTYIDKLDREVEQRIRTLNNSAGNDDAKVLTEYDGLGRLYRESAPCLIGSCAAPYWTTNAYDLLNRPTQSQRPISATNPTPQTVSLRIPVKPGHLSARCRASVPDHVGLVLTRSLCATVVAR
jgi:hypothetical protein